MSETVKKNGTKRDVLGRFTPGNPGGPGRGRKKKTKEYECNLEGLRAVVKEMVNSKDAMERGRGVRAGKALIELEEKLKKNAAPSAIITPMMEKILSGVCPHCGRGIFEGDNIEGVNMQVEIVDPE
ncbi:hypothetical protein D3OALGA1CA_649 [Olavius algarvensis associated proteobacterium Delta 3]|nr:hypothetical protein D3OALGA1CA_649 [Olavius algarvensis associated proteobacterium Delta 3]CAB5128291.1 hypothetical protein D3OALGB2SA_3435 [Olavius algarvensis associated proteobacterium Delta 3]